MFLAVLAWLNHLSYYSDNDMIHFCYTLVRVWKFLITVHSSVNFVMYSVVSLKEHFSYLSATIPYKERARNTAYKEVHDYDSQQ